jgi:hypothetical protein
MHVLHSAFLPQLRNDALQSMKHKVSAVADHLQRDPQQFFACRNAKLTTSTSRTTRQTLKPLQQ